MFSKNYLSISAFLILASAVHMPTAFSSVTIHEVNFDGILIIGSQGSIQQEFDELNWGGNINSKILLLNSSSIKVSGNFTNSGFAGNRRFDFGNGQYLEPGNNTLVSFGATNFLASDFLAISSPETSLSGSFQIVGNSLEYVLQGGSTYGSTIDNSGAEATPQWIDFTVDGSVTTATGNSTIRDLKFANNGNLVIQSEEMLTLSNGEVAVENGSSVVSGGTLTTQSDLNKTGTGELQVESTLIVPGTLNLNEGSLIVSGTLQAQKLVLNPGASLGGSGLVNVSQIETTTSGPLNISEAGLKLGNVTGVRLKRV